jgi:hypothetical protein
MASITNSLPMSLSRNPQLDTPGGHRAIEQTCLVVGTSFPVVIGSGIS